MLNAYGGIPPPPPRYGSSLSTIGNHLPEIKSNSETKEENAFLSIWRESIGVLLIFLLSISVLFSSITIVYYAQKQKIVYDELVDYLDKTVSISKINYNPVIGLYEIRANELETLTDLRKYKTDIWTFLFSDLACFLFFIIGFFIYFTSNLTKISIRFLFWFFVGVGTFYSIAEVGTFSFIISSQIIRLPNATENLLDHSVPHNLGGLMQMEARFGCIFNQNLYTLFKRRQNNGNTCDPYILNSFITQLLLIIICVCRLVSVFIFFALALLRNPVGDAFAKLIIKMKPTQKYKNRYTKNPKSINYNKSDVLHTPKTTTFSVTENRSASAPPSTPPLGQLDHSISYNNAAFFAISGMTNAPPILNSSQCSEISKCDAPDMIFKGSTHTTSSLVSEV